MLQAHTFAPAQCPMSFIAHELTKQGPYPKVHKPAEMPVVIHVSSTDDLFAEVFGDDE